MYPFKLIGALEFDFPPAPTKNNFSLIVKAFLDFWGAKIDKFGCPSAHRYITVLETALSPSKGPV